MGLRDNNEQRFCLCEKSPEEKKFGEENFLETFWKLIDD